MLFPAPLRRSNAEIAEAAERNWLGVLSALCVPCLLALVVSATACSSAPSLFRQYEYEEEVYLALDRSATIYVNSSLAALNALHGASFDLDPASRADVAAVRAYYTTPLTRVIRVSPWRRNNRRFVGVRLEIDDIDKLGDAAPFAWSRYDFRRDGDLFIYRQTVGSSVGKDVGNVGWDGRELAAFRLHLPSKIRYHNTRREVRGNILEWEQPLAERLKGVPLALDARMDPESILYRTLWLFGITFIVVAAAFVIVIAWVMRRGRAASQGPASSKTG
jgi:hypothetical protein